MTDKLIRYSSNSTVGGKPVGEVYVVDIEHLSGRGSYSLTKDPAKATRFTEAQAQRVLDSVHRLSWPGRRIVDADSAKVLPPYGEGSK